MSLPTPYYDEDGVTLYHGDSRDIVAALDDASIDMIFTDPPYGHNNNDGDLIHRWEAALGRPPCEEDSSLARPILNDGPQEASELAQWLFRESKRILRTGSCCCCCCCCCGGGGPDPQFARWSLWMDEALNFKQMVVWDKGPMGMGWHYRRSYEVVLVAQRDAGKCNWYDETDRIENIVRHIPKVIPSRDDHPTPKPVALAEWFIQLHTQAGDTVMDPFNGGGSTALACRRLGRRYIGIELDERWCALTVQRLARQPLALPL